MNFKNNVKFRKYNNFIEAAVPTITLKKFSGLAVVVVVIDRDGKLKWEFSWLGFVSFIFWSSIYYYCTYKAFYDDQTILRCLYDTKLKHYGDILEKLACITLYIYSGYKLPFEIGLRHDYLKQLLDIDDCIRLLGVHIDYCKISNKLFWGSIFQVVAGSTRLFSVWILLSNLDLDLPFELLVQASIADIIVLAVSAHYVYYLLSLLDRYKIVNDLLVEIKDRKSWEHVVLVRGKQMPNVERALQYQDKYICEKIKGCSRIYGMIYIASQKAQVTFGFSLACCLLFCLSYIILYLFYLMEATAGGLFHDMERFIYFVVFIFWQIFYSTGVIFLIVYFSEAVVAEAAKSSYVIHQIISADFSAPITSEVGIKKVKSLHFSIQLLHQMPVFTARGLCKIDYMLLLQGARTITTFLVILLQFVTD